MQISTRKRIIVGLAAAAAVIGVVTGTSLSGVHAQIRGNLPEVMNPSGVPYAEFQYATLTGANNTINATRVPIVTAAGTSYQDLTINLEVGPNGQVSLGTLTAVASPSPQTDGFIAGTYVGPSTLYGGNAIISVSGPGIAPGGQTMWSQATASGAYSLTYPDSSTWYVDSPTDPNNPLYSRIKAAGITTTAYAAWGVVGGGAGGGSAWNANTLIAVSQTANALTFVSYSNGGTDYATPQGQITFTLQQ